jgi:O-antigen/teichoic acid export membrane protein
VLAALQGWGAWALVAQQLATALASVLTLWGVTRWRPGLHFDGGEFRELFGFGINIVGSDVLTFVSRNTDNLLIGYFLGPALLGLYAVGYRILTVSETILVSIARKIAFPAFSRLQGDPDRMVQAYLRLTRAIGAVILPGYIALAIVAPELTVVVFGSTWRDSGIVASVLFLIGPIVAVQAFAGSMLNAAGHPEVVFRIRLITAVVNVTGFLVAVRFGIVAVAGSYAVRGYLLVPFLLRWMERYAGVPALAYLAQLRGVALATAAMALAIFGVRFALGDSLAPTPLLALEVAAGAPAYLLVLFAVERPLVQELLHVLGQALPIGRLRRSRAA